MFLELLTMTVSKFFSIYRFPQHHWNSICTANVLERAFKEVRRRTNVIGRFLGEKAPTYRGGVWCAGGGTLKVAGVRMKVEDIAWIEEAAKVLEVQLIEIEG